MLKKHPVILAILCCLILASCSQDGAYTKVGKLAFDDPALKACVLAEAEKHGWQEAREDGIGRTSDRSPSG